MEGVARLESWCKQVVSEIISPVVRAPEFVLHIEKGELTKTTWKKLFRRGTLLYTVRQHFKFTRSNHGGKM